MTNYTPATPPQFRWVKANKYDQSKVKVRHKHDDYYCLQQLHYDFTHGKTTGESGKVYDTESRTEKWVDVPVVEE